MPSKLVAACVYFLLKNHAWYISKQSASQSAKSIRTFALKVFNIIPPLCSLQSTSTWITIWADRTLLRRNFSQDDVSLRFAAWLKNAASLTYMYYNYWILWCVCVSCTHCIHIAVHTNGNRLKWNWIVKLMRTDVWCLMDIIIKKMFS